MRRAQLRGLPRDELEDLVFFYEDVLGVHDDLERLSAIRKAFGLSRGPAWMLSRLIAADGRLFRRDALMDYLPANDPVHDRGEKLIDVYVCKIRRQLGADAVETEWGIGWRLTPLGRLRCRRALNPEGLEA